MTKIRWAGLKEGPDYDLYTRRPAGMYDVVHGVDGWVVYTPVLTGSQDYRTVHAFNGREWTSGPSSAPPRGVAGAVSRDDARRFAETLIHKAEGQRADPSKLPLPEIADAISGHLKRFEADPKINSHDRPGATTTPYYHARAYAAGRYVGVVYVTYQGASNITKDEAAKYLTWLDAGHVGRHFEALRELGIDPHKRRS